MVLHMRYNSLYISLPSSAKQQREMTNSALLSENRELRRLIFRIIVVSQIQFRDSFDNIPRFVGKL